MLARCWPRGGCIALASVQLNLAVPGARPMVGKREGFGRYPPKSGRSYAQIVSIMTDLGLRSRPCGARMQCHEGTGVNEGTQLL